MNCSELEELIRDGIEGVEHVRVSDMTGGGDHFEAVVVASSFREQNMVKQHQAVYGALGDLMRGAVHALALKTLTPEQWQADQG